MEYLGQERAGLQDVMDCSRLRFVTFYYVDGTHRSRGGSGYACTRGCFSASGIFNERCGRHASDFMTDPPECYAYMGCEVAASRNLRLRLSSGKSFQDTVPDENVKLHGKER